MSEEKNPWQLRFERERKARKESELLLENKSQELWEINQSLENQVSERTNSLKKALDMAEMSNKAKDQFMANISHELKTPLNSINIISSIMKKNTTENLDDKQVKNLGIINNCGKELLLLVNDLLDLSKIDKGLINIKNEQINLQEFIEQINNRFISQIKEKSLTLSLNIDISITHIYSDLYRLNQIIDNLLSNAIKFTSKGKISLFLTDENENIKILIKDEGIGISEDQLLTIFDRFKQVDGSTSRKYGGTGLGLSITKELVSLLKGEILVSSELDKGTTFELIIPKTTNDSQNISTAKIENDFTQDIKTVNIIDETITSKNKIEKEKKVLEKVLILNNNPITFIMMIVELRKRYEVFQATNLVEFLKINSNNTINKAILDISTLKNEEYEKLLQSENSNFVMIHIDEVEEKLNKKSILKIQKKEIRESLNKI